MPVTSVESDPDTLTLTVIADFSVPVQRLWAAYEDPRQLEQFWGPPGYPATFIRHDLQPGGRADYYMSGSGDDRSHGYWEFIAVDTGRSFHVVNGFANRDGAPDPSMPSMRMTFAFEATDNGSRLVHTTSFSSLDEMETILETGMEEGLTAAMGQIDRVLAGSRPFTIAMPITDRQRSYTFYQKALGLIPIGEPAEDGVPEPLQFHLDQNATLMLIPAGGFGWVIGKRVVARPTTSECLLSLTVNSAEEVTEIIARMGAAGGDVAAEPAEQDWGFVGVATDPDGHAWQIIAETAVSE